MVLSLLRTGKEERRKSEGERRRAEGSEGRAKEGAKKDLIYFIGKQSATKEQFHLFGFMFDNNKAKKRKKTSMDNFNFYQS